MRVSRAKIVSLWVMSLIYVAAGVMHFVMPRVYVVFMPPYLPLHRAAVYVSGAAMIVLALGLLAPRTRRLAAWGLCALLVVIFPADLYAATDNVGFGGPGTGFGGWNWARAALQPVLVLWAWWYTRP